MDTVSMCACVCVFVRVCVGAFQCTWMVCIVCSMERVGSSGEGHGCIQGRWWWRRRGTWVYTRQVVAVAVTSIVHECNIKIC